VVEFRKKKTGQMMAESAESGASQRAVPAPEETPEEARMENEGGAPGAADVTAAAEATALRAEKQEWMNVAMRRQADFDNYRKRIERERHEDRERGARSLMESLLPVLDAFDRALAPDSDAVHAEYQKGFEGTYKLLRVALAKHGLEKIDALGKPFSPHLHHAIDQMPSDEYSEDTVIEELQGGYLFHGRLLRPAMVRVAVPGPQAS
jgi:molecular chaperone GrpE